MIIEIDSIYSFSQSGARDNQEDSRYPDIDAPSLMTSVFAVCDGVGGNEKGEVASSTVCCCIGELMAAHANTDKFEDADFRALLTQAYKALDKAADRNSRHMATTLTFLAFHSEGVLAAHIGDSRIYQFRPGEGIIYRSEDHSLVNALLRSGNISPDEVRNHPKGNVITRCMTPADGVRERDEATVVTLRDVAPGDYFLLCTDGVSGHVEDEELLELYSSDASAEEKYHMLADRCKDSSDNNTAIQIRIGMVTIEPEAETGADYPADCSEVTQTQKLFGKDVSARELAALSTRSKIKVFFNRLFK